MSGDARFGSDPTIASRVGATPVLATSEPREARERVRQEELVERRARRRLLGIVTAVLAPPVGFFLLGVLAVAVGAWRAGVEEEAAIIQVPFDAAAWNRSNDPDTNARRGMTASVRGLLRPGMTPEEVIALLGDAGSSQRTDKLRLAYLLGDSRRCGVDVLLLEVVFDEDDVLERTSVRCS
jgi:hypothetical protein